ncbi:DUF4019 domain-containing protein [Altererythrobacter sp. BO-6]|uniref:helix-turn-helix domain-containing protein n=1 Tax=Altererythrobacter sp. BO-6 TaxID=2604537 RepID=UPI0013E169B3|nr:DUF4019 domain-containing protein [Altererythrobacter sp. BO-6]QIG52814.1 DUF4019 domain-containing protein [Altererythrobacter sp. BO-6]
MLPSLDDLTDKEKEALRLLLAGHDAKSSAGALDISVHTVNDRLRNARRKLGVSSSREAARILGDAEGAGPQIPAHTSLGIPRSTGQSDTADLINTAPHKAFGLTWFAGGMLIMSIIIAAAVIVSFANIGSTEAGRTAAQNTVTTETGSPAAADDPVSIARAEKFMARVDARDWEGSWKATGPYFRSQASLAEWTKLIEPVRTPLGKVESRRLVSVQRTSTVPGAPEGDYQIIQFQTDFAGREMIATETVVMLRGQNGWEIVGFFIA